MESVDKNAGEEYLDSLRNNTKMEYRIKFGGCIIAIIIIICLICFC